MKRTLITPKMDEFPTPFVGYLQGSAVYDSSCSPEARVFFIDRDGGYYLKKAPKDTLRREADMTRFFHSKGLATEVLAYESLESDWMMTARVESLEEYADVLEVRYGCILCVERHSKCVFLPHKRIAKAKVCIFILIASQVVCVRLLAE